MSGLEPTLLEEESFPEELALALCPKQSAERWG